GGVPPSCERSPGPMTIGQKIASGFAIVLALLVAGGYFAYRGTTTLIDNNRAVNHSHDVLSLLDELHILIKDAEAEKRDYLLTGKPEHLELYEKILADRPRLFERLHQETADNPNQRARLNRLEALVNERMRFSADVIAAYKKDGVGAAGKLIAT